MGGCSRIGNQNQTVLPPWKGSSATFAGMLHVTARATSGTFLFRTHAEARALWDQLTRRTRILALALMPDHIHIAIPDASQIPKIITAMRGFALQRHHWRRAGGPVWEAMPEPSPIRNREHLHRTIRYIHLNPCRKGLVKDPLAWPWSSHRDAVGLAIPPIIRRVPDPERFHKLVSADPSVHPEGTTMPFSRRNPNPEDIFSAVSALTRTPVEEMRRRGSARDLFLRAARILSTAPSAEIAALAGTHPSTVRHASRQPDPRIPLIERVLGDLRFSRLENGPLRHGPSRRLCGDRDGVGS